MNRVPDFSEILTRRGRDVLEGRDPATSAVFRRSRQRYLPLPRMIDAGVCARLVDLLEKRMAPVMAPLESPIPSDSISGMKYDYSESLQKVMRMRSGALNGRARAARIAGQIGVTDMLRSPSLLRFAEQISGFRLNPDCGCQVLCYGPGDYVGPHNDHHPESPATRHGYLDIQITLVNDGVKSQWLLYERNHHLNEMVDVNRSGLISAYFLPFWHMTTPLVPKPGREATARRWLLLATYELQS